MQITILTVGKMKEAFFRDAIQEYQKRLSKFCTLQIFEVADEKTPDNASLNQVNLILKKEGERLLKRIPSSSLIIALAIEGKALTSEELASYISQKEVHGCSHITFIIGGSLGLSQTILNKADLSLSFSKMTFPHQLMRVILLEQVYRSYKIKNNEPYHK